ncbi:hypothetical protein DPMN_024150 [Dreissena polymorpha]|uniref:Uncharacterized protein n=1 Tax=Dreissena polymorpha TaxID=45954 RepID=A0A9D4RBC2_DREPO|nr:hypothetical protein DPMN_024150 [Dreissena polymorpha]
MPGAVSTPFRGATLATTRCKKLKQVQNKAISRMEKQFGVLKKTIKEVHKLLPQKNDGELMTTALTHLCNEEEESLYSSNLHLFSLKLFKSLNIGKHLLIKTITFQLF